MAAITNALHAKYAFVMLCKYVLWKSRLMTDNAWGQLMDMYRFNGKWVMSPMCMICPCMTSLYHISYIVSIWATAWKSMMTSSNGNIFRVTGPFCGEFTGPGEFPTQRPVTRSFEVFFDLRLNKRLSKQTRCWWFETQSWSLWRHCNG